jgi:L-alanine-DL-glutamate epimerase-like enolase superfamily enzyme
LARGAGGSRFLYIGNMAVNVRAFELHRLELPSGRRFGDCSCWCETLDIVALCLESNQGHCGWGFGQTISKGIFTRPAPYIVPMPSLAEMHADFERTVWPVLTGRSPFALILHRPALFSAYTIVDQAIRMALWDLMAQSVDLPLYQFLGALSQNNRVRAYGSGLDFPLSEEDAVAQYRRFIDMGFTAIKVKVGATDPKRDLRRLQAIREAVGAQVEIAIDANEAWTCDEAIDRIRFFEKEGIRLSYVEDPLHRDDVEGMVRLNATIDIDVVGHDYHVDPGKLRRMVERKALSRLRVLPDIDFALACADIATDFGVPLIFGNSPFELSVHAAIALPSVDRLEFSDLGWNLLPKSPIRFENGYAIAPSQPGIGLDPDPEKLKQFGRP